MNSRGPDEEVKSVRVLRSNFKWNARPEAPRHISGL
jgi:hypothetical protein